MRLQPVSYTHLDVYKRQVVGWTTHHAIVEYKGKWYLFHHDCVPSGGTTWLRSLKVCELEYDAAVSYTHLKLHKCKDCYYHRADLEMDRI